MKKNNDTTPLDAADTAARPDIRQRLQAAMNSDKRNTQAVIARETGISGSAISQWLKGVYPGDNDQIESRLSIWLTALDERRMEGEMMPSAPVYVVTPTATRIIGALCYAQAAGDIAVIYGGAGLGKTTSVRHYVAQSLNVWHVTMTPASASVVTSLEEICETLGVAEQGGAAKLFRAIVRKVRGSRGLLVIDEAQHLSVAALDQIRSIHDATGIGIALVGNQEVYARLTGGSRAVYLDRLHSRVGKRLGLRASSNEDIEALIAAWDIDDRSCRKTLVDIARRPGALRTLTKVLRLAGMHAAAAGERAHCEHINKAWRELGGAE